jgi:hypothetical protein
VVREGIDFTLEQSKRHQWRLGIRQPGEIMDHNTVDSAVESTASRSQPSVTPSAGRARVQLKLEDEDGKTPSLAAATLATSMPPVSAPLIYMQDDDPEFDDYDEEDPDDDLDI